MADLSNTPTRPNTFALGTFSRLKHRKILLGGVNEPSGTESARQTLRSRRRAGKWERIHVDGEKNLHTT